MLRTGLPWREVAVLRAYARYARQLGNPYGMTYMAETLLAAPVGDAGAGRAVPRAVRPALEPGPQDRGGRGAGHGPELIDAVTGLDADRILRGFLGMITRDAAHQLLPGPAVPVVQARPVRGAGHARAAPRFEIFVYSPRVEGVHLRYGPVARGGLRWSDRPQDFRTEILGLVKAQAVKNAVIVPVGAKGGFVLRRPEPAATR